MSKVIASPDITLLDVSVLLDLSTAIPTATVTNLSTVVDAGNLQWIFEFRSPSGTPIHIGDFSDPDIDGVAFTTFQFAEKLTEMFGQIEFSKTEEFTLKVSVKDSNDDVWDLTIGSGPLCKPYGNNGKNNFGAALIDAEVMCHRKQIYVTDKSSLTYGGITGTKVSTTVRLSYPPDPNGDPIASITNTQIPALFPIQYEGEGHNLYAAHVYDYDLGDFTVRIRYSYTSTMPVWCNVSLQPLLCEVGRLSSILGKDCNDNAENRKKLKNLTIANSWILEAAIGVIQPLSGVNVPKKIEEVKALLQIDCDCCRPAGIPNTQSSVLLADAVLGVNKICGDASMYWTLDVDGNPVLNYQDVSYVFAMSGDAASSEAFEFTPTLSGCTKTISLYVDKLTLAEEILNEFQNNDTFINILNEITQQAQLSCSGLDGKSIFSSTTCDYTTVLNARTNGTAMAGVVINATTYSAPGGTLLSNNSAIQTWLNGLGLGTWVVSYNGTTKMTTITTAANTNAVSTALTVVPPATTKTTAFSSDCGLMCTIFQKIIDYLDEINLAKIKTGTALTICTFKVDGTVQSTVLPDTTTAQALATAITEGVCNVVNYTKDKLLTCANLKTAFATFTNTTGDPDGADIVPMFKDGNCQQVPLKNVALGIFKLLGTDTEVKNMYCLYAKCDTVSDCEPVSDLVAGSGTDTTQNYTWTALVDAIGYKWSIDGLNYTFVISNSAFINGLTADTSYTFRVFPVYNSGDGDTCEITDTFVTTNTGTTCATPANLVLNNVEDTSFTASWDAVTGATGYQYSVNGAAWVNAGLVLTVPVSGLTQNTLYNFAVRAIVGGTPCTANVADDDVTTEITINYRLSASYGMSIDSVTGTGVPSPALPSTGVNGTEEGYHTTMTGGLSIVLTGATVPDTFLVLLKDGSNIDQIDVSSGPGTYSLAAPGATAAEFVEILLVNNA